MDERFKVTRAAAIGYGLYYLFFRPESMSWWLVIGGGAVMLCIVTAVEARWQRNSVTAPIPNPGAGQDSN
jgi:hypothetical protein